MKEPRGLIGREGARELVESLVKDAKEERRAALDLPRGRRQRPPDRDEGLGQGRDLGKWIPYKSAPRR
jgi:hypothetical protein